MAAGKQSVVRRRHWRRTLALPLAAAALLAAACSGGSSGTTNSASSSGGQASSASGAQASAAGGAPSILDSPSGVSQSWSLKEDFQVGATQANPNPDRNGNTKVWWFLQGKAGTDPVSYSLLPNRRIDSCGSVALTTWSGSDNPAPGTFPNVRKAGAYGHCGQVYFTGLAVDAQPGANSDAIIGWRSQVMGRVSVYAVFADHDGQCGDGVRWTVKKGPAPASHGVATQLGGGPLPPLFAEGEVYQSIVDVKKDDFLYFEVGLLGQRAMCNATLLDITIGTM